MNASQEQASSDTLKIKEMSDINKRMFVAVLSVRQFTCCRCKIDKRPWSQLRHSCMTEQYHTSKTRV